MSKKGFRHCVDSVEAMIEMIDGKAQLALDCGLGWTLSDAIRIAREIE